MNSSEYQEVEEEPPNDTPYQETLRDIIFWIARNSNAFIEHTTVGVNLFHLFVLFQKPLRTSSIFILMIGICLSDILAFTFIFYYLGVDRNNYQWMVKKLRRIDKYVSCLEDVNEFVDPFGMLIALILNATRPISIWLAILMALIRSLSIIFPMSNRIHKMTKPSNAILMVVTVCSFWIPYYSWDIVLIEYWYVPSHIILEGCPVKVNALRNRVYILVISSPLYSLVDYRHTYEYLVRLIPAVFYPFLTVSLLIELWRIRKKRANMKMEKSDNTTILIFFMTISFMLSEGLEGLSDSKSEIRGTYNFTDIPNNQLED
uniref:G_PROTEIN_RECEP_F1_2 domain-containing protein n=1 Tax=Caenorhabditis tropicalis TaxID=1561998 RepID=A0A1I7UE42_9PELO